MSSARNSAWIIGKQQAEADNGMVASLHPLASAAGLEILKAGGNAVDAAVATAFAIGVVEPFMSGAGGVAAMVFYSASTGKTVVVDGSGIAPRAARPDSFELDDAGTQGGLYGWRGTKGNAQNQGFRAPIVPGMPAAMLYAHATYGSGKVSRAQVLAPAIRLADEGFPVDGYVASTIAYHQRMLRQNAEAFRTFFHADGTPLMPGSLGTKPERLVQKDLARTLTLLAEGGVDAYYRGEIARMMVDDFQANGGMLTLEDFADYADHGVREFDQPLAATYRDYTLHGIPKASGCVTAYQALNILEQFDLAACGAGTAGATHLIAEALRRAFLDRLTHLADPDRQTVPFDGVLSKGYAQHLASTIDPERATPNVGPGDPWAFQETRRPALVGAAGGDGGDTCTTHLTAVDADRNVVTLTTTLGELFGSGVMPRGTGVTLNGGMTWFNPEPGTVNSIEPGKRIFWAPTPTIVLDGAGQPILALGAPGGRRIMSAVLQSIVNVLDFGMGVQDAVTAPRIHCEGPTTLAEARLGEDVLGQLAGMGHQLDVVEESGPTFSFARPNGIAIDHANGRLTGGVNQFTPSTALGY
ncbi:MAG: gamma-glutamyltransferase [Chloroflexi bacterium]|nr:gamma-glutamyltransferase [Chloroflexota bacterium]